MKKQLVKFFLPVLSLGALIALVTVVGCSNANSPTTSYNDTPDALVAPNYSTSATTTDFSGNSEMSVLEGTPTGDREQGKGGDKERVRNPRLIIRCLELSKEQMEQFNGFMRAYEECTKAARETYRAQEQEIRNRTRAAEKEIRAQVEAGTMTKDEARAKMKEIGTAARTALQAAREAMDAAIKACLQQLYASIESILTPAQVEIWRKWMASGVVPCKEKGPREPRDTVKGRI